AEIMALKQAGTRAQGSVMYVTLEPCCHYGRTPPCSQALIAAGITEVHLAMLDPNPLVCGKGRSELEREGIRTYVSEHEEEAREINEAYLKYITTGMPFVTVKFAMSLDGKIATKNGDSRWISGSEARRYVHYLRYTADAIMVGANTVLLDDPSLTARCGSTGGTVKKQPLRVIIDGRGRTSPTARVFSEPGKVLLVVGKSVKSEKKEAFTQADAELLELPLKEGQFDLKKLLKTLGERGVTSILVEGGGILLGSLFDAGLVDKVIAFIAPVIIGGGGAKVAVAGKGVDKVVDSIKLRHINQEKFGEDLMISAYIKE
ncbi:MAG: bifunctional diaminohydroxyphosphoribosylaminopyrimidine deaminase/5-amino-6-(5-phosphoribosylamino)uracil reductase RibD, partial [Dehalococcoidales bacterium]|nr:bifunctional diaminohydroxyphosphoribosylaminopyrimidine deaminase/5-amino-6-(5-phosphoribosylamino)uracil reductase RibD [Dehalococcoidales bacterium]